MARAGLTTPGPFTPRRRLASASLHIAGLSTLAIAATAATGLVIEVVYGDAQWRALAASVGILGAIGVSAWRFTSLPPDAGGPRGAVRAVGVAWITISLAGAVPYVLADVLPWDLAIFESVSGLTGTGSTVLAPIEGNTHGILFYRQMTQWVGGMGVVVLAVAVLPFLRVGGLQLFRAESPGPTADQLVPRVSDTARRLWSIYCALTAVATLLLLVAGLSVYEAVSHAATAVGTGGFSPYNDSISHFDSVIVEAAVIVSMFLGAVKFPLFYAAFRGRDLRVFWRSSEFRFFVWIVVASTAFVSLLNRLDGMALSTAVRESAFNVVSLMSSCGFGTADFTLWAPATQIVLLFLMVTGSMAGSTSGALKLFRVQVVAKHAWREVRRVRHPSGVFPIRLGRAPIPETIVRSVLGYVMTYFLIAVVGILTLSALGSDLATAAGSVVTAMGGVGPGLGEAGPAANFLVFDFAQRAVLVVLMLVGRLEIFPLLVFVLSARSSIGRGTGRITAKRRLRDPGGSSATAAPARR